MNDELTKPVDESSVAAAMRDDPATFGSKLVKLATDGHDREFSLMVIKNVKELVKHRAALQLALQKTQDEIALFDRRISAIDAGEFSVDGYGNIRYKDSSLQY